MCADVDFAVDVYVDCDVAVNVDVEVEAGIDVAVDGTNVDVCIYDCVCVGRRGYGCAYG